MVITDLLDCIFLCLVVHLLEDFCESLSLVSVGRTRLTARTSLVWPLALMPRDPCNRLSLP